MPPMRVQLPGNTGFGLGLSLFELLVSFTKVAHLILVYLTLKLLYSFVKRDSAST